MLRSAGFLDLPREIRQQILQAAFDAIFQEPIKDYTVLDTAHWMAHWVRGSPGPIHSYIDIDFRDTDGLLE